MNTTSSKFIEDFYAYNALMRRIGSKTKTLEQYKLYREGKLRAPARGKGFRKSKMEAKSYIRPSPNVPSGDGIGSVTPRKNEKIYTGDKLLGIATMHKSNMVPVFSQEDAEDISKMRR